MKKFHLLLFSLAVVSSLEAQQLQFFTPNTVRVSRPATEGGSLERKVSEVVIASPENVKVTKTTVNGTSIYKTSALIVTVKEGVVSFADAKGNLLTSEGASKFTEINNGPDKGTYRVRQEWSVDAEEGIYGIGLLQNGKMSQRGENRKMEQNNLEDYAHFFQSLKGYGIYWDNYSPTQLITPEEGKSGMLVLESQVGNLSDYYFMYGGNADGVIKEMRHLTGQVPMIPMWTYGFHQSRERYKSQKELLDVVHTYRKLGVPFDGIIQDWQYWGSNYLWNAMEFLNEEFGNAQGMIDEVHKQNAHMSISIWASFGPHTKGYRQMEEKGHLLSFSTWPQSGLSEWPPRRDYPSGVRCYDPYSQEARDIYWDNLQRLHKMGIDAWWMDSTDPDHLDYQDSDLDEMTSMGSWRSVRNIFPLESVKGVYTNQRKVDNSKRVFILTRSYFAGQQRYGANTWSGDIGSSWENFRKQIPICLNYTLTANPYVNTDIGGFFANAYNKRSQDNTACRNPQYQELYVRWMQFGAFCPMMRSHGTEVYRELYHFGKAGEPVYDALVDAVKLRYRLMPYIYSTAWQVSKHDDSFMRALMMDFKEDKNTWNNNREYMFGHNILVCPVIDPLFTEEKIVKTDILDSWGGKKDELGEWPAADWSKVPTFEVYLPGQNTRWFDFWNNEEMQGGKSYHVQAPLGHSPLYVKAGSILPMGPDVQFAAEKAWDNLTIRIYPGANASFTLYEDEGDNYNYEQGMYTEIPMTWNEKSHTLTIGKRTGSYEGMLQNRQFTLVMPDGSSKTVKYSGKAVKVKM